MTKDIFKKIKSQEGRAPICEECKKELRIIIRNSTNKIISFLYDVEVLSKKCYHTRARNISTPSVKRYHILCAKKLKIWLK